MHDPTVELSAQDERQWQAERQEDIAAICWKECPDCNGRGWLVKHWEAEDGGPDYTIRIPCVRCRGKRNIQLHDPLRVEALYTAADDARRRMGVGLYTRIASALSLAIGGAVMILSSPVTVASASVTHKVHTITYPEGCDCYDAHYRATKFGHIPACKHQIAVWLVKAAEKKMAEAEQFIREERGYD